ncbi:MAG: hypothetical protein IJL87_01540 [Clostridia bacterium]|nr:hypothetical protein [Clostridia bacterium]
MSKLSLFMSYALLAVFAQNLVLTGGIGASRLIRAVRKPRELLQYTILLTFFTVLSQLLVYPVNLLIKDKEYVKFVRPISVVLCITAVYLLTWLITARFLPRLYERIEKQLTHCAFNGIAAGVPIITAMRGYPLWHTVAFSIGASLGFMLAALLVSEGLRRVDNAELPYSFVGIPASLIYIGILSLAFAGISGAQIF